MAIETAQHGVKTGGSTSIPADYLNRVYAGVLGKLIGVYLGRPVEGWTYDQIMNTHGEVDHYLQGRFGEPLVSTDDDITGTFTFLRALEDNGYPSDITPQQIANAWLNYTIERRTIFWWGGLGNSTEHTAYLRLMAGIPAPESGSKDLNGKVISEQIGAQIFIDGWGMVAPGDPERAADLARRAASVSHDGEAIFGAQVIAAMEAQAFDEPDLSTLLDTAVSLIPGDSVIARLISDVREWHSALPEWRMAREKIVQHYGYDRYVGPCHMVPNHALIIMALLYGNDDFRRSLMIVNTAGWDTDCNSANVGCLLGIKNGLTAFDGDYDWRGPVADRLYLPTGDGGRAITDAVIETLHVVNAGRALANLEPLSPKDGAKFHFELPGSVQGFQVDNPAASLSNVVGHSVTGERSLRMRSSDGVNGPVNVTTATFIPIEASASMHYELIASPTLYSGQKLRTRVESSPDNPRTIAVSPVIGVYDGADQMVRVSGPGVSLSPGDGRIIEWSIPDTGGYPVADVGVTLEAPGDVFLDWLTWTGAPKTLLDRPDGTSTFWRRAWVNAVDHFDARWPEPYRINQNHRTGLISQGTRDWRDYGVEATVSVHLAEWAGLACRVQGLRRFYALVLARNSTARLIKSRDEVSILAEVEFAWETFSEFTMKLDCRGNRIRGWIDGQMLFDSEDAELALSAGGVGLVVHEGCLSSQGVRVYD